METERTRVNLGELHTMTAIAVDVQPEQIRKCVIIAIVQEDDQMVLRVASTDENPVDVALIVGIALESVTNGVE